MSEDQRVESPACEPAGLPEAAAPAIAVESGTAPAAPLEIGVPAATTPEAAGDPPGDAVTVAEPAVDVQLKAIVEALIFASPDPLTLKAIGKVLEGEAPDAIARAVGALQLDYAGDGGLQLVEVAGGFQIVTRSDLHEWVRRLFHERSTQKLSVAALETLAVIAYKQPITAAEVAEIRGVNTSGVLGTLIDRKLVKIVGRKQVVGRPFMYATTREFLNRFGLRDLDELPKVEDMADALGFDPPLVDDVTMATLPFDEQDPPAAVPPAGEEGA